MEAGAAHKRTAWGSWIAEQVVLLVVFTALSVVHTWPLATHFLTHLAGGRNEDPWMNAWHLDWVRHCVLEWKNPFFADVLHAPLGAELYWHTLVPGKSIWGLFLIPQFGSLASYNIVVFTTFVLTGLTSYWLFSDLLRNRGFAGWSLRLGAFAGACVFDFSRYHLAHATAHMDLSSLEGLPLYLLFFFRYLEDPKRRWLAGAALSIAYVSFCDFYYIYYLALFSLLWVVFRAWKKAPLFSRASLKNEELRRALRLGVAAAIACLPAIVPLLMHLRPQPIGIHHGDSDYPADPLLLVAPDFLSAWQNVLPAKLRDAIQKNQFGILNDSEGGVFLGIAAPILAFIGWRSRDPDGGVLVRVGACFLVLSLGTHLNLGGVPDLPVQLALVALTLFVFASKRLRNKPYARDLKIVLVIACLLSLVQPITAFDEPATMRIPLPYVFFKHMVPLFGRGGMPVRFLLLTQICIAALAAFGAARIVDRASRNWHNLTTLQLGATMALITGVAFADGKNVSFPLEPMHLPGNELDVIRDDPEPISVLTDHAIGQWEQSIHHRPISYARQSRLPVREVELYDGPLYKAIMFFDGVSDERTLEERAALFDQVRRNHYRYYVGHNAAAVEVARHGKASADELMKQRQAFVEGVLGGKLIFRDDVREIYRFW